MFRINKRHWLISRLRRGLLPARLRGLIVFIERLPLAGTEQNHRQQQRRQKQQGNPRQNSFFMGKLP